MKKVIVFVFLLSCLGCTALFKFNNNPIFALEGVQKVCFVSDDNFESLEQIETVKCGDLNFNFCSYQTAKANLEMLNKDAKAVQFYFQDVDVEVLLKSLKCQFVTKTEMENLTILSAYTGYYPNFVFVEGKKMNVQIAVSNDGVVAGFPAIMTGF